MKKIVQGLVLGAVLAFGGQAAAQGWGEVAQAPGAWSSVQEAIQNTPPPVPCYDDGMGGGWCPPCLYECVRYDGGYIEPICGTGCEAIGARYGPVAMAACLAACWIPPYCADYQLVCNY